MTENAVTYRPVEPTDSEALIDIAYRAFSAINAAHCFPPDFASPEDARNEMAMIFALPFVEGVLAEIDGRPVGSGFVWHLGEVIGVGPVTVDPDTQGRGIGRGVMQGLLEMVPNARSIRLVQAAFNIRSMSLYASLGFDIREPLVCMTGTPLGIAIKGYSVRPGHADDIGDIATVGHRVLGLDRAMEFSGAIQQGSAAVVVHEERIVGYTTGVGFYGHTVAEDNEGMKALIAAAPEISGPGFFLPTRNGDLFRWCLAHGLRVTQPMSLMSKGNYEEIQGAYLPNILF